MKNITKPWFPFGRVASVKLPEITVPCTKNDRREIDFGKKGEKKKIAQKIAYDRTEKPNSRVAK